MRRNQAVSQVVATMLILMIVLSSVGFMLVTVVPDVQEDMRVRASYDNAYNQLKIINEAINDLVHEGAGAQRVNSISLEDGSISVDSGTDRTVIWYSLDPNFHFNVSGLDDSDETFTINVTKGSINRTMVYWLKEDWTATPCFLAGTRVALAGGGYKNIEDIGAGDLVKTYDENTGGIVSGVVSDVFDYPAEEMGEYYLVLNNALSITPNHNLYSNSGWVSADDLRTGDILLSYPPGYMVHSIEKISGKKPTYSFEVDVYHNYFISIDNTIVLAHDALYQLDTDITSSEDNPWKSLSQSPTIESTQITGGQPPGGNLEKDDDSKGTISWDDMFFQAWVNMLRPFGIVYNPLMSFFAGDNLFSSDADDTVVILDKHHENIDAVPGTRFYVERTIDGTQGLDVRFATLFTNALTFEEIEVVENTDSDDAEQMLPYENLGFAGCQVYTAGCGVSDVEKQIDTIRTGLPCEIQELERVAYSDSFKLDGPCTVRVWFRAPAWEEIKSGGSSSGRISFLVFSENGGDVFDFECSSWWDSSYFNRKKLMISNTGPALTDFQVNYTFDHASMVLDDKSLPNGSDIRIVDENGVEVPRCLDDFSSWNRADTMIWFNVTVGAFGSVDYYLYYNKSGASDPGYTGDDVFIFWDDFSEPNLNTSKWCSYTYSPDGAPASVSILFNMLKLNAGINIFGIHAGAGVYTAKNYSKTGSYIIEYQQKPWKTANSGHPGFYVRDPDANRETSFYGGVTDQAIYYATVRGTGTANIVVYGSYFSGQCTHGFNSPWGSAICPADGPCLDQTWPYEWNCPWWHNVSIIYDGSTSDGFASVSVNGTVKTSGAIGSDHLNCMGDEIKFELWRTAHSMCNRDYFGYFRVRQNGTMPTINTGGEERNEPPNEPSNPNPAPGATSVGTTVQLSVTVDDPNEDTLTVYFYNASDGSLIDTDTVASGGTASVIWANLGYSTTYYWNISVSDGVYTTESLVYNFTTGPPWIVKKDIITPSATATAYNNGRKLVRTSNGELHCVYTTVSNILYSNSTDNGQTWTETQLAATGGGMAFLYTFASLAVDSNNITHVVWSGYPPPYPPPGDAIIQIRYVNSTDDWADIKNLTNEIYDSANGIYRHQLHPSIAVDSNDVIHLVWHGKHAGSQFYDQIRYVNSTDWNDIKNLTPGYQDQGYPSIAVDSNDHVHVVWSGDPADPGPTSGLQIRYREHTESGWSNDIIDLTDEVSAQPQQYPCIAVDSDDNLHVVWHGVDANGKNQIRYMEYTGGGSIIEDLTTDASHDQAHPSIAVNCNDDMYVVWYGTHAGSPTYSQIRYKKYYADSESWGISIENLTSSTSSNQQYPNLIWALYPTVSGTRICRPKTGFGFVFCNETTVKYYNDPSLDWNTAPEIEDPYPGNRSTNISLNPMLSINVTDADGDVIDPITWKFWHIGSEQWVSFAVNTSNPGTTTYRQNCSYFSAYNTWYNWMVTADDGLVTTSKWFTFKTQALQVNESSDDCEETDNWFNTINETIRIGNYDGSSYDGGFRFQNVKIDKDENISGATLNLYINSSGSNGDMNLNCTIYGINLSNPDTWSESNKPSDHLSKVENLTVAHVDWTLDLAGLQDKTWYSYDVKPIIKEIINHSDWSSGNSLSLVIEDNSSDNGCYINVSAWDRDPYYAANLSITPAQDLLPIACFTWEDKDGGQVGTNLTFDARCSGDDWRIVNYSWDWDADGEFEADKWYSFEKGNLPVDPDDHIFYHDYDDYESHRVRLRVFDDGGQSSTTEPIVVHADVLEKTPVGFGASVCVRVKDAGPDGPSWSPLGKISGEIVIYLGPGNYTKDTMCIVLYNDDYPTYDPYGDKSWNLTAIGEIWLFDSNSIRYELPSREGTYEVALGGGGGIIRSDAGGNRYVADGPIAYAGADAFALRINQIRASSYTGGTGGRLRVKTLIGLNCGRDKDTAYGLRQQFHGDNKDLWINYFVSNYDFKRQRDGTLFYSAGESVWFRLVHATVFVTIC